MKIPFISDNKTEYLEKRIKQLEKRVTLLENASTSLTSDKEDPLLSKAIEISKEMDLISTGLLQHKLKIGYARAAAIMDEMEEEGYIGPAKGNGEPRELLKK